MHPAPGKGGGQKGGRPHKETGRLMCDRIPAGGCSSRQARRFSRPFRVGPGFVGAANQIVHTGVIKIGNTGQHVHRDVPDAVFIVAVGASRQIQIIRQLLLGVVVIFPQVLDSLVIYVYHHVQYRGHKM